MKTIIYWIEILLLGCFIVLFGEKIIREQSYCDISDFTFHNEDFRRLELTDDFLAQIQELAQEIEVERGEIITTALFYNRFKEAQVKLDKDTFFRERNRYVRWDGERYMTFKKFYASLLNEIQCFPVPVSTKNTYWVNYENSWGMPRTYGGERTHEGTDIFADENVRGLYPVIAAAGGTVTNKGWLEKGGYRIGITSDSGIYYYYAHLERYGDVAVGDRVEAGQLLGYMGDTGYSKVEGTTGKFPVHLHFGLYVYENGEEISLNPYWILKSLEKKVLYYPY